MKIQLQSVEFDGDIRGPGAKADGADSAHHSSTFAADAPRYKVLIEYDTDLAAVRLTHPTAKEHREKLVPWSRVVQSEVKAPSAEDAKTEAAPAAAKKS